MTHTHTLEWEESQNLTMTSVSKNVKKLEPSYTTSRSARGAGALGSSLALPHMIKHEITAYLPIPSLGTYTNK